MTRRLRAVVAGVLVLLGSIFAPLSVVATWVEDLVGDTDSYLATVGPLAEDPAIQDAVASRLSEAIVDALDVTAVADEAVDALVARGLPPDAEVALEALSGPLADGIREFVVTHVNRLVHSDGFHDAWVEANREAHSGLVAVLTGEGDGAVRAEGNAVTLDLALLVDTVRAQLLESGFSIAERIPDIRAEFRIVESTDVAALQDAFRALSTVALLLSAGTLLMYAAAVVTSRSRRRTVVASAVGLGVGMLLLGAALSTVRALYLDSVPDEASTAAAAAIFDHLFSLLRLSVRTVLALAVVVAVAAWLAGPSASAGAVRRAARGVVAGFRGPFGDLVVEHRTALRVAVVAAAVAWYALTPSPTGTGIVVVVIAGLVALLVIELAAHQASTDDTATPSKPEGVVQ